MLPALLGPALEPVSRDAARHAAERELSKQLYQQAEPSPVQRLLQAFFDRLQDALGQASEAAPGGLWGLVGLLLLLVALVVVVRLRVGPLARTTRLDPFDGLAAPLTAAEHRRRADEHAAAGRYAEAVRERLRAVVGELEQRAILEPRAGRTATEVAAEAGLALPALTGELRRAAGIFDDIWYGGRPATAESDAAVRALDEHVRAARTVARANA